MHNSVYQANCRLTYNATGQVGFFVAALQVEDFSSATETVAMSSVPVQILIRIETITVPANVTAPMFVGDTPEDGACIAVASTFEQQLTARSGGDGIT